VLSVKPEVISATLAGLLHDIGKFAQRSGQYAGTHAEIGAQLATSGGWRVWLPSFAWDDVTDAIGDHHARGEPPTKRITKIIRVADRLTAGERLRETLPGAEPAETALVPILSQVALRGPRGPDVYGFALSPLNLERSVFFPSSAPAVNRDSYARHWSEFEKELAQLSRSGAIDSDVRLTALTALLRKYLWCVPSATPLESEDELTRPDVSLYDHIKVTAALAACLEVGLRDDELDALYEQGTRWQQPVALLVRGDLSWIQSFIYRITRPEATAEYEHVAKRLRGRSFYVSLLGDVVAEFFLRQLGLPAANLLFAGGGRFDLLAPAGAKTEEAVQSARGALEDWLLQQFTGDLGLQIALAEVRPADLGNMEPVYDALDARLQESKQLKGEWYLFQEEFHVSPRDEYHACRVCHTTPLPAPGICHLCAEQAELGRVLPHASHLVFAQGDPGHAPGLWLRDFQQPFGVQVGILAQSEIDEALQVLARGSVAATFYRLNDADFLPANAPKGLGYAFRFLANAAPIARQRITSGDAGPVETGDVLHFEAIASLSSGSDLVGVLKADVDRLGQIMGEGLSDQDRGLRPTISRISSLSSTVEMFFAGWINELCDTVAETWAAAEASTSEGSRGVLRRREADGAFYVMYSGGDDLLIVGPWDAILLLAERLRADWSDYGCQNPNITLSAGVVLVKPRYPVQRFAGQVNEALEAAKSGGRDRISVFGQVVPWTGDQMGYGALLDLGRDLVDDVRAGRVPRTLVYDLGRLERQSRSVSGKGYPKPMWTPRLYYTLARRLSSEARERYTQRLIAAMPKMQVPVSYVSLKTREE